jgi:hypothetical protein
VLHTRRFKTTKGSSVDREFPRFLANFPQDARKRKLPPGA